MKKFFRRNKIRLPKYKINKKVQSLSEVIDWGLRQSKIPETWQITEGEGVNVYVLDTAGGSDHLDLKNNIIGGVNYTNSRTSQDINGHGTHCAGIIAASKNNFGMIGVAPKAKVFLVKVLSDNGSGSISSIEAGLQLCLDSLIGENPAHIVSMSLGGDYHMGKRVEDLIKRLHQNNVPVLCAAGNSGREGVNYPAKYKETIAIGAYDKSGRIANFSTYGKELDFAAPGVDIYSTWTKNSYASISGTSMATPFVAGVVALMISKHKKQEIETGKNDCKTVEDIKNHLIKYSIDKGSIGKDKEWGYGIIDVNNLIKSSQCEIEEDKDDEAKCSNIICKLIEFLYKIINPNR